MSVGEKIEKFVFDTNWSAVGKKIKKVITSLDEKVRDAKMKHLKKMEEERNKK